MAVSSRALVELVFLGPANDRRQLQDSPVLGDVWIAFAENPAQPMDLLITPHKERSAGPVAVLIAKRIRELGLGREPGQEADIAYLQGFVAARLFFQEVISVIVPMTDWWWSKKIQKDRQSFRTDDLRQKIDAIIKWAGAADEDTRSNLARVFSDFTAWERYIALAGIILWAGRQKEETETGKSVGDRITRIDSPDEIMQVIEGRLKEIQQIPPEKDVQVWQVSLNRKAMPALEKSVAAVKGDAARTLFNVKCSGISWAVLDSGIDASHPVFRDKDKPGESRVIKTLDFSNIRKVVSLDNLEAEPAEIRKRLRGLWKIRKQKLGDDESISMLKALAKDADNGRPIDWETVEKLIEIDPRTPPPMGHGTHVAGIIGACGGEYTKADSDEPPSQFADGMCPDINLFDFRVLANSLQDTEFAIIAALQYIRFLNERHTYISIHGANLSLSIPHDVRNFACGRTPICNECERLVESGVVVVAAAGNLGYQSFETRDGSYEGYTAFSVTDPGNADGVITVGATHRYRPHTYGVSYFSSRGPTGDGRLKPDLVAPGERIESSLPGKEWGELDGTSMAAPHVSGAAAMLMARYAELIGEPRRIKSVLCESATDLGRERSFQGYGMLDVLRAFQKV